MKTQAELLDELRGMTGTPPNWTACGRVGKELAVSQSYVFLVAEGKMPPGPAIYEGMGYELVKMYRAKGEE
jgi:hypothetical protein